MSTYRPAVRIICFDTASRVLLLKWRDPSDGHLLWEPPGGGIEPGETPFDAACRELHEETGISSDCLLTHSIDVERDVWWNGTHFVGPETFFVAHVTDAVIVPQGLGTDEVENLVEHRWLEWSEIGQLTDPVEPPNIDEVLTAFVPTGPWAGS